jgi:hypothetical protein
MRVIAPNIQTRLIAVLCFAVGLAGQMLFNGNDQQAARFLVQPYVFSPKVPIRPEEIRDVSEYEYGGIIEDCTFSETPGMCQSLRERARKFVLANWKAQRKSFIVVDYYCADCMPEDKIFIEPGTNGAWHIVLWHAPQREFERPDQSVAVDVKRKRAAADDWGYKKGEQMLVFVDANGERVGDF